MLNPGMALMTGNPPHARPAPLSMLTGFLLALSLLLPACGPSEEVTPSPTASPAPSLPVPSETPTAAPPTATPTTLPTALPSFSDPAAYEWAPVVSGLELPVDIQNAGDGTGRLFVVEKSGRILVFQNNQLLPQPFLDILSEVDSRATEQGLLGLAFHPKYAENGLFFVNYIDINGNTIIARFHVSTEDPNRADPASEVDLLHVKQPYANHNGGGLAFGPDGYLYIGLGDGGSEGDPLRTGQNLQTLLGKLLRIGVDSGDTYTIPPDNPFAGGGGLPEIWAYGLRNPWRFSFDRLTGNLYIGDVGQDKWEEVDFVPVGTPGGMNFGWSFYEGMHPYQDQPPANATFTWPVAEYSHSEGCAVTGGYIYRGSALPEWQGVYFYGDYCSGRVWGLIQTGQDIWQAQALFETGAQVTTFGVDEAGEIYLTDYLSGALLRLTRR
jgi:glucose/arabinose dehydrogenase